MADLKFTKGVWSQDNYGGVLANGKTLRVSGVALCAVDDEVKANTTLITAAPELYQALQELLVDYEEAYEEWVEEFALERGEELILAAKSALAKARGE